MRYLLNDREARALRVVCRSFYKKTKRRADQSLDLFVYLGDDPSKRLCWSATSGRLPTFRTGSGRMYHPASDTWMTPKDKLTALGFPTTPETAIAMGVPILPVADVRRAASIAGNSFHFSTAAVVQLCVLSSFKVVLNA